MFILSQDMATVINTDHVVKISTKETAAPTITAILDNGESVILGSYLPEDTVFRDHKLAEIYNKLSHNSEGVFITPYSSEKPKPGEFIGYKKGETA